MNRYEIEARNARIIDMYKSGMSQLSIGNELNLAQRTISGILSRCNIVSTHNHPSKKFSNQELIDAIANGITISKFAEQHKVSLNTVHVRASRLNLQFEHGVTKKEREEMHRLRELGYSNTEIAERVSHCSGTVRRVVGKQPKAMTNANILYGVEKRKMNARRRTQLSAIMINVRAAEAEQKRIEAEQKATAEKLRMILAGAGLDDGKIVDFEKAKAFVEMMDRVV